jgi:Bax protein
MANMCNRKVFNFAILAVLGSFVVALGAFQVAVPVNSASKAPKAVLPIANPKSIVKANIDAIKTKKLARPASRYTVSSVNYTFATLGYELSPVLEGDAAVPRVFLSSLPYDLRKVEQTDERKSIFFRTLLPLVLQINENITADRAKLWRLRHRISLNQSLKAEDTIWLDSIFKQYDLEANDFETLLDQMDIVPPSLALAQAAEESGWGTSRFALEGNALFGQWTLDPNDKGLRPNNREEGKNHRIKAFNTLSESLTAYVRNLNTNRAYEDFRKKRSEMRRNHESITGNQLALTLDKYSERGIEYVGTLQTLISQNELERFDKLKLDDSLVHDTTGPLI